MVDGKFAVNIARVLVKGVDCPAMRDRVDAAYSSR